MKRWLTSHCLGKRILVIGPFDPEYGPSGSKIRVCGVSRVLYEYADQVDYVGADDKSTNLNVRYVETKIFSRKMLVGIRQGLFRTGLGLLSGSSYRRAKFRSPMLHKHVSAIARNYDLIWVNFLDGMQYMNNLDGSFEVVVDLHNNDLEWYSRLSKTGTSLVRRLIAKHSLHAVRREMKYGFPLVDSLVCVSDDDAGAVDRINSEFGLSPKSIVFPNCINGQKFLLPSKSAINRDFDLGFVGSLAVEMNHRAAMHLLEEILPLIIRKLPHVRLVIAGTNPRPALIKKVNALRKNVVLMPNVDDIDGVYRNVKIFVMPFDKGGGTKLKYLEAAAARCLVISTPLGAQGFEVTPDRDYICCKNTVEFSDAASLMLSFSDQARHIVNSNYLVCEKNYRWESYYPEAAWKPCR